MVNNSDDYEIQNDNDWSRAVKEWENRMVEKYYNQNTGFQFPEQDITVLYKGTNETNHRQRIRPCQQ